MASKTITISEQAYRFLRRLKQKDKSFSDVILSVKKKRHDIMSFAGALKKADLKSVEQVHEAGTY